MSHRIHYLSILAAAIMIINSAQAANRDGCKNIGDPCVCSNTGNTGMCFPGTQSQTGDQLYCVCQSDTMTADEITQEIIKKYTTAKPDKLKEYDEKLQPYVKSGEALRAYRKMKNTRISKKDRADHEKKLKGVEIFLREIVATGRERVINVFFGEPHDNCRYPGQACVCDNTGAQGICSINRPGKKIIYQGVMYCHCD